MTFQTTRRNFFKLSASAFTGSMMSAACAAEEETNRKAVNRNLKITSVKTFLLRHRLKRPLGASVSVPLSTIRETLLVKIETDAGLVGWGETAPISGARGTIDDHLAPRLIGQNPLEYRKLWRSLWGPNFGNGLAVGALETAINDIRGKALNMSIAELFGGKLRDRVPVYVSALAYVERERIEDAYPKTAAAMVEKGHKAIKMRLGRYSVKREAAVAAKVRKTVGPKSS